MERGWGFASLQTTASSGLGDLQVGQGSMEDSTESKDSKWRNTNSKINVSDPRPAECRTKLNFI